MKLIIVTIIALLGICSVVAAPKTQEGNESAKSREGTGPGV